MWLSKQQKRTSPPPSVDTGQVTIADDSVAVELDSERRNLCVYAPGGYVWKPSVGQKVLVLKSEGESGIIGLPVETACEPGEISLSSEGGAQISLKNDASIVLDGEVKLNGSLTVGGETLTAMIERVASAVIASHSN